jgi:hypothetical protein
VTILDSETDEVTQNWKNCINRSFTICSVNLCMTTQAFIHELDMNTCVIYGRVNKVDINHFSAN